MPESENQVPTTSLRILGSVRIEEAREREASYFEDRHKLIADPSISVFGWTMKGRCMYYEPVYRSRPHNSSLT